ncbi:MAG TPA: aminotransferase class V-fold PLP-dependent enzyme [Candidatus Acidoferrales bacterium]|nr:aminotransferase class V-fold PLP-dependent enzyme [Candidatus Acidoferrales bacterium]
MLTEAQVQQIRSKFPIFQRKIYLNSCSQGALSKNVEAILLEHLRGWHEGGSPWDVWVQKYEQTRAQFAQFIGAEPDEVAVVPSASAGINSVASAIDFAKRPKIVMGEFEFPTMGHVWLANQRRGARIEFVAAKDGRLPADSYAAAVDERTAVVPLTHMCFMNGFRSDVAGVTRIAHAKGALVFLDDYQDCGTRPVNVKALDVDFYVTGTLKYLLACSGVAFLYVRKALISSLPPTISGWFAQTNPFAFDVKYFDPSPSARRFEAGTPPIPNIYAASAGIALLQEIGLEQIADQIRRLAQALIQGAQELGIQLKTPPNSVGPLVVLRSNDVEKAIARLAEQNIVVSGRHDGLRISFHVHNTLDDVQQVLAALKKSADLMVREGQPV